MSSGRLGPSPRASPGAGQVPITITGIALLPRLFFSLREGYGSSLGIRYLRSCPTQQQEPAEASQRRDAEYKNFSRAKPPPEGDGPHAAQAAQRTTSQVKSFKFTSCFFLPRAYVAAAMEEQLPDAKMKLVARSFKNPSGKLSGFLVQSWAPGSLILEQTTSNC